MQPEALTKQEQEWIQRTLDILNPRRVDEVQERGGKPVYEYDVQTTKDAYRKLGFSLDGVGVAEHPNTWRMIRDQYRSLLTAIVETGRLPESALNELTYAFATFTEVKPSVEWKKGRATISYVPTFGHPDGQIMFSILRLSQIPKRLMCCEECETFALIVPGPGRPATRYCSDRCRNRATARRNRAEPVRKSPAKPARHK